MIISLIITIFTEKSSPSCGLRVECGVRGAGSSLHTAAGGETCLKVGARQSVQCTVGNQGDISELLDGNFIRQFCWVFGPLWPGSVLHPCIVRSALWENRGMR